MTVYWPRREVHLVLVICLEWLSLPMEGVEHFNGRLNFYKYWVDRDKDGDHMRHSCSFPSIGEERE